MRVVSRKLPLPTVENCRDLGGIHTEQGRMVRPGLLVRSANLHDARHDDLETLAHRGISNIIDLRTNPERDLKPDRLLEDWSFYALPTFRETKALRLQLRDIVGISNIIDLRTNPERDLKPDRLLEDWSFYALPTFRETKALRLQLRDIVTRPGTFIEDLYPRLVLDDAAVACWKRMFRLLIDEPGGYLFHCTQGKDRTGIAAALILAALEVPEDVIRDDYLQTNLYMSDEPGGYLFHCTQGKDRTGIAAALILAALEVPEDVIRDDYLQTNLYMSTETPAFVDTFEALLGPKAHADIDEFLVASPLYFQTYIDATASFGGPVGYLRTAIGLSEADLRAKAHADIDEFLVASPLYFQTYIDATASFGGPVGYLRTAIGLSEADLRALRDFYLTDDASN